MAAKESDVMRLKREMKEKSIGGAYLFYGEELYLRDLYIDKFKAIIPDDDFAEFNLTALDGRDMTIDDADEAIESFPMAAERKLVIIRDSGIFKKADEATQKFWSAKLKNMPDYCVLLFVEDAVDKRQSLYKTMSKCGTCVEFSYLKPYELAAWVQGEVLKNHRKMNKNVIEYFISVCPEGLVAMSNELSKLFTLCGEEITESDVNRCVSKSLSVRIFDLTDCIMEKKNNRVIEILNDLKTVKESVFTVLYLLNSAFDMMLLSKLMRENGANDADICSRLGLPPFIAKKYLVGASKFSREFLKGRLLRVPELDLEIKQGKITEWEALYSFVFEAINAA